MGPGKADLLEAIARHGSISAAAREMKMSYRRAWILMDSLNHSFGQTVVETATGGQGGGGASVTEAGREILRRYRRMESKAAASIENELSQFAELARVRRNTGGKKRKQRKG
jgi:molybdate transport system regulatory protein